MYNVRNVIFMGIFYTTLLYILLPWEIYSVKSETMPIVFWGLLKLQPIWDFYLAKFEALANKNLGSEIFIWLSSKLGQIKISDRLKFPIILRKYGPDIPDNSFFETKIKLFSFQNKRPIMRWALYAFCFENGVHFGSKEGIVGKIILRIIKNCQQSYIPFNLLGNWNIFV